MLEVWFSCEDWGSETLKAALLSLLVNDLHGVVPESKVLQARALSNTFSSGCALMSFLATLLLQAAILKCLHMQTH